MVKYNENPVHLLVEMRMAIGFNFDLQLVGKEKKKRKAGA